MDRAPVKFGGENPEAGAGSAASSGLHRPWDAYDAYLFDIDGTLLNCRDAVHYHAFLATLKMLSGRALDLAEVTTHGNTDIGILRDALARAGVAEGAWRPRIHDACNTMCAYAEQHREDLSPAAMPGTHRLLQHLRRRGALLAVATGNLERIGRLKLGRCGLLRYFQIGAFSDGFESREEVFRHALNAVHARSGSAAAVCAVGDTPSDIRAARACGIDVIAVATGAHLREQLVAEGPNLCLSSLLQLFAPEASAGRYNARQSLRIA
jgi:phosphoglycolate phosphatase